VRGSPVPGSLPPPAGALLLPSVRGPRRRGHQGRGAGSRRLCPANTALLGRVGRRGVLPPPQSQQEERIDRLEGRRREGGLPPLGPDGRCPPRELPTGCHGPPRPRLGGASRRESTARLLRHLGLRAGRSVPQP